MSKIWPIRQRCKVNWLADLSPTQDRSLAWCRSRGESDKPSLDHGVCFIKNLTQFKCIVSRDISERSKITTTLADKIILETFWLRHRERQPDLPQWGNCSAKEPYRDQSAQPNTQLRLHYSLCRTCAHKLENTQLHLLPPGKHFPETLFVFFSLQLLPRCRAAPLTLQSWISTLESDTSCQGPQKNNLYWIDLDYITSPPRWRVYAVLAMQFPGWAAAKGVSMDTTANSRFIHPRRHFYIQSIIFRCIY